MYKIQSQALKLLYVSVTKTNKICKMRPNSVTSTMALNNHQRPGLGVAVIIKSIHQAGCVLLGVRKGSIGAGTYALPGGHLEFGEALEECAARKCKEETGLLLTNIHLGTVVNAMWTEGDKKYNFVTIAMVADILDCGNNEPRNMEPNKYEGWNWVKWDELPPVEKLFKPLHLISSQFNPFNKSSEPAIVITNIEKMDGTTQNSRRPGVGIGVIITSPSYPECVLIGVRKGSMGDGTYSIPGGHLDIFEEFVQCAHRETLEETNLKLKNVQFAVLSNCSWAEAEKHYHFVHIVMSAEVDLNKNNELLNMEPNKCEGWEWRKWSDICQADKLFGPMKLLYSKFNPFNP